MESHPQKASGEGNKKHDEVWTEKKQKEHTISFSYSQPPPTEQENKANKTRNPGKEVTPCYNIFFFQFVKQNNLFFLSYIYLS